jgi:hypothetical protein
MGILLFIVSIILGLILIPVGIIVGLISDLFNQRWSNILPNISSKFRSIAIAGDIYGNCTCSELFNLILIKENGYKFGKEGDSNKILVFHFPYLS